MAVVTDVYPSREQPIPGVTGELVVDAARRGGHRNVHYCPAWKDAPALLRDEVGPGDVRDHPRRGDVNRLAQALVAEEEEGRHDDRGSRHRRPWCRPAPAGACSTSAAAARRRAARRKSLLSSCCKPLAAAVGLVALPVGVVAWVLTAPLFRLRAVEVRPKGSPRARRAGLGAAGAGALQGQNLVRLSLADAAARCSATPGSPRSRSQRSCRTGCG